MESSSNLLMWDESLDRSHIFCIIDNIQQVAAYQQHTKAFRLVLNANKAVAMWILENLDDTT